MASTMIKSRRIVLNISGEVFETFEATLRRFPETLLGDYKKRRVFYNLSNQYYFDRNFLGRLCFDSILYFYQSNGVLKCPTKVPVSAFKGECEFFQLPSQDIERMVQSENQYSFDLNTLGVDETPDRDRNDPLYLKIWDFLEYPTSSAPAKVFAFVSILVVLLSVLTSSLETMPELQNCGMDLSNHWMVIDLSINVWFLTEFLVRLAFSPSKVSFACTIMNWVDCVAVIPYFLILSFSGDGIAGVYHHRYLRVPRFVRVFRLFRLSNISRRLRIVSGIMKSSVNDLQLLMLCMLTIVTFWGSVMFVVEEHYNPGFVSTPEALWWAVQTITTVGYGDLEVSTLVGKLTACVLMVFGAGTMSLPILGITTKFMRVYSQLVEIENKKKETKRLRRKEEVEKKKARRLSKMQKAFMVQMTSGEGRKTKKRCIKC